MRALQVIEYGDPRALQVVDVPLPQPGPDQVLVKVAYAGLNMVDSYWCRGEVGYRSATLPFTPGMEAAGEVVATGADVATFGVGDRVVGVMHPGAFAEYWAVPASKLVEVPHTIELSTAAALALQGFTAAFLTHWTYPVSKRDTVLVHSAAGGVGSLIAQFCRSKEAVVIGTCSTAEKAARAAAAGCRHVIRYDQVDFVAEVQRLTQQRGVDVVFDSVGRDTFARGLTCLRPRGMMCLFGQSSGAVEPFDPQLLRQFGSLYLTRPSLSHHIGTPAENKWLGKTVFEASELGELQSVVQVSTGLESIGPALDRLMRRQTHGKSIVALEG